MDTDGPDPLKVFDSEKCETCGTCLSECHYLKLTKEQASEQIRRLKEGLPSAVLNRCVGCWSCDGYCPNGCRPYSLIRSRWYERYGELGLPEKARYLMPTEFPNFRSIVKHTPEEAELIEKIKQPPDADAVMYTGCNTLVFAQTLQSGIFEGLPAFGSFDYCCGEMFYRMGLFDSARESALKMKRIFGALKARRIVFACAACMNMLTNIYPKEFGIEFGFESVFITDWLQERIAAGAIEIKNPLDMKVAIQDSCHVKVMGAHMYESPRRLLGTIGATVTELEYTREESHCCGVAAGCARYGVTDLTRTGMGRLAETRGPRPDATVCYCNGCLLTLAIMRQIMRWAPPLYPLIQLVQLAAGENPQMNLTSGRAWQVLMGIVRNAGPKMISTGRFFMPPIE